jgi:dTMP kinase
MNKIISVFFPIAMIFFNISSMDAPDIAPTKLLKKGFLIAVEGIDGAGKTTIAQKIHSFLQEQGFATILTREPGDTELGKEIRTIVQTQQKPICNEAQFLLFAADRAQHVKDVIKPALAQNKIVISDRLADSSLAYQGYGQGLDLSRIQDINNWVMDGIKPDVTIFVCVPIDVALERCNKRGALSAYEKKEFLEKVAAGFEKIYKGRTGKDVVCILAVDDAFENCKLHIYKSILCWLAHIK